MMLCGCNLRVGYDGRIVIDNMDISINRGEIVTLIGPNGSGKTTALKAISRLLDCAGGVVLLDGKNIHRMSTREVAKKMAVLPQSQIMPPDFSVLELVRHGRMPHLKWYEVSGKEDEDIVEWAIQAAKLEHLAHRPVCTLSGGERQKAWIALALAQKPEVLLLDEPTTFLDICHQIEVMEMVQSLNKKLGITVVMVLHDLNQAASHSNRIVVIKGGRVVKEGAPQEVITPELLRDVYRIEAEVYINKTNGCPAIMPLGLAKFA
ncbi:MAG: ABC transporter ATP-binding protein [Peptococcaceae bacterium]|nr:ABC transporter ATP-binding protein [Peptococcaceae bacterium]